MRFSGQNLFIVSKFIILFVGLCIRDKSTDIILHDTYFVVSNLHISMLFAIMSTLAALLYYAFERINRPIRHHIGLWHFGLFAAGQTILFVDPYLFPRTIYDNEMGWISKSMLGVWLFSLGFILFLLCLLVFIYGAILALLCKNR